MLRNIEHQFKINQEVYHTTTDGPKGRILDISYSFRNNRIKYYICWNHMEQDWYDEIELSESKTF